MPRQATFSIVPETLAPQPDAVPKRPMTSKQAQKLYREKTRKPRMSKQEMRRWELAEQERIRKELEKEKQLNRARFLRDKKKQQEKEKLEEKKKSGQPIAPPRPSQPMITAFARKKVVQQKKASSPPPPSPPSPPAPLQEPEPYQPEQREESEQESKELGLANDDEPTLQKDEKHSTLPHKRTSTREASQSEEQESHPTVELTSSSSHRPLSGERLEKQPSGDGELSISSQLRLSGRRLESQVAGDEATPLLLHQASSTRRRALPIEDDRTGQPGQERAASPGLSPRETTPKRRSGPLARESNASSTSLEQSVSGNNARPSSASPQSTSMRITEIQTEQSGHTRVASSISSLAVAGSKRCSEDRMRQFDRSPASFQEPWSGVEPGKPILEKWPPRENKGGASQNKRLSGAVMQPPSGLQGADKENHRPTIPSTQAFNLEAEEIDWDCIMTGVEENDKVKTGSNPSPVKPPTTRRTAEAPLKPMAPPPRRPLEPLRSSTSNSSRPPSYKRPPTNTPSPIEPRRVSNGVQKPKYLPPHLRTQTSRPPSTRTFEPKVQPPVQRPPEQTPPTSTQLFLLSNFDEIIPSLSQEARELSLPVAKPPTACPTRPPGSAFLKPGARPKMATTTTTTPQSARVPAPTPLKAAANVDLGFLSTQDLVLSTQDLREIKVPAGTPMRTGPPVFLKPKCQQTPNLSQTGRPVTAGRQFLTKRS